MTWLGITLSLAVTIVVVAAATFLIWFVLATDNHGERSEE